MLIETRLRTHTYVDIFYGRQRNFAECRISLNKYLCLQRATAFNRRDCLALVVNMFNIYLLFQRFDWQIETITSCHLSVCVGVSSSFEIDKFADCLFFASTNEIGKLTTTTKKKFRKQFKQMSH